MIQRTEAHTLHSGFPDLIPNPLIELRSAVYQAILLTIVFHFNILTWENVLLINFVF